MRQPERVPDVGRNRGRMVGPHGQRRHLRCRVHNGKTRNSKSSFRHKSRRRWSASLGGFGVDQIYARLENLGR